MGPYALSMPKGLAIPALVIAASIVLAACGGGADATTAAPAPTTVGDRR
jgi:predicted small secreted protein